MLTIRQQSGNAPRYPSTPESSPPTTRIRSFSDTNPHRCYGHRPPTDRCRRPSHSSVGHFGEVSLGRTNMDTYHGHVRSPADAIILFEACRLGLLPRVQRRLSEKERQSIRSGSIFVWDEREAGMRRWTDGKSWSASRVSGSFLTYREMEGKRGGGFILGAQLKPGRSPNSSGPSGGGGGGLGSDSEFELIDEGPDGYRYKPDGLMKQSFSITTSQGQHLHLISYYSRAHPTATGLKTPTTDPALRHIRPAKGMYPESTVHEQQSMPVVTRAPMPGPSYSGPPQALPPGGSSVYARSGGPPPQNYPQHPHAWPPSPVATPPHNYNNGSPFGHSAHFVAPNGSRVSPSQYGQPVPPNSTSSDAYTRSPVRHPDASLPPPPHTSQNHRGSESSASGLSNQIPNPASQPRPEGEGYQPLSRIDPRLTALTAPPPAPPPLLNPPSRTPDDYTDSKNVASSIPSINSLMNGAPVTATQQADSAAEPRADRSGSRSPGGSQGGGGPHDIPSEKLGFREDMRALKILDRAFSA